MQKHLTLGPGRWGGLGQWRCGARWALFSQQWEAVGELSVERVGAGRPVWRPGWARWLMADGGQMRSGCALEVELTARGCEGRDQGRLLALERMAPGGWGMVGTQLRWGSWGRRVRSGGWAKCRSQIWGLFFGLLSLAPCTVPGCPGSEQGGFPNQMVLATSQAHLASRLLGWGQGPQTRLHRWALEAPLTPGHGDPGLWDRIAGHGVRPRVPVDVHASLPL